MVKFNEEIERIIQQEVDERCSDEKKKVEFWAEVAKTRANEKDELFKEFKEVVDELESIKKEKEHNKHLLYLVKDLELEDILDILNESTREPYLKAHNNVPIWFKILFESKKDNRELIEAMIALGVDIPKQVLEFKNPINYSKKELIDLFSTKTNFYVTNGHMTEHNARFFFDALRAEGWSFNPNRGSLPLQLLLRNPLILDEEVFGLAIYVLGDYAHYISSYHKLNVEQSVALSEKLSNPYNVEILLKCEEKYESKHIQNEFMKLDLIGNGRFRPQRNLDLLTDENKVKYLLSKKEKLNLNDILNISLQYEFTEKLTKEILNEYLQ